MPSIVSNKPWYYRLAFAIVLRTMYVTISIIETTMKCVIFIVHPPSVNKVRKYINKKIDALAQAHPVKK